ncbi:FAD/NAD(P)-binding protein [Oricola cellulosilytica]|nr:FAD/NAD(P)-binding protein [Oricola cellulosilytica]
MKTKGKRSGPGTIGIVGSGATAAYLLKHLAAGGERLKITVFESSDEPGFGMPYRPSDNADFMLCNAFSREIPVIRTSLIDWLKTQPSHELNEWELSRHDLSARAFYPRTLIGEFLHDQFAALVDGMNRDGHSVSVLTNHRVEDLIPNGSHVKVRAVTPDGPVMREFDNVVLATGHSWPTHPTIDDAELVSPWPYTNMTKIPPGKIGVLGASLSAIDVVVTLGHTHGDFDERGATVSWKPNPDAKDLKVTMVSHMGIMPEGDFYYPFPYKPLRYLTKEAVKEEIARGAENLLERVFELLVRELDESNPEYLDQLGDRSRTIAGFAEGYFRHRQEKGGLDAVKEDFEVVRQSMQDRTTIPHRYVLLRGHEEFDAALRHLNEHDWEIFTDHLMPVFADCYAAVPHLSLARIIALYDAGVLDIVPTGSNSSFSKEGSDGVRVQTEDEVLAFDAMIDARGQDSAPLGELPFPSLTEQIVEPNEPVERPFAIEMAIRGTSRVYCLALPQVIERHPFSQGLANMNELAEIVATDLLV